MPDPAASLTFDNVLDTSLQVHWEVPPNINGILTGNILNVHSMFVAFYEQG